MEKWIESGNYKKKKISEKHVRGQIGGSHRQKMWMKEEENKLQGRVKYVGERQLERARQKRQKQRETA